MSWLLDGNVLVALTIDSHEHHHRVQRWFDAERLNFATCLITQGTLLRVHMTMAADRSAAAAWRTLKAVVGHPDHVYWEDSFGYGEVRHRGLRGAKQVTDAWLAELARRRGGRVATLDFAFAAVEPEAVFLVPGLAA